MRVLAPSGSLGLLPEQVDPLPTVPDWPDFLRGYRQSLDEQLPEAPRTKEPYRRRS